MKTLEPSRKSFSHEALLYSSQAEFLSESLSFIREGLDNGEPMLVVVNAEKITMLREELNGQADGVHFADMAEVGANPARIIPAWHDFVEKNARPGQALRGIGEPIWAGRGSAELVECQRHESLLNLAFADTAGFRLLCPYDTAALDEAVLDEAHRSHRVIQEDGVERGSRTCRSIEAVAAPFDAPLPDPPAGVVALAFGRDDLEALRQSVSSAASEAGLGGSRTDDLVLAVNELATNSVRHGGGRGTLRVWREDDRILCEVRDSGRIADPLAGRRKPVVAQGGGFGLWLVNQLCDLVQIRSLAAGGAVRLHMRVG